MNWCLILHPVSSSRYLSLFACALYRFICSTSVFVTRLRPEKKCDTAICDLGQASRIAESCLMLCSENVNTFLFHTKEKERQKKRADLSTVT